MLLSKEEHKHKTKKGIQQNKLQKLKNADELRMMN